MKIIVLILSLLVLSPTWCLSCDKGCEEFHGTCACLGTPEMAPSVKPSDEKPHHSQIPEWQEGGVQPALPPSLAAQDAKQDQEKSAADAEGKKKAGL